MKIYIKKTHIKKISTIDLDSVLIIFICFYFLFHALNLFMKLAIEEPHWWGLVSKGTLTCLLAFAFPVLLLRKSLVILAEIFMMGLLLLTIMQGTINTNYKEIYHIIFNFYFVYIPLGMSLYSIRNIEKLLHYLYRYSRISVAILLVTILIRSNAELFISSAAGKNSYNMAIGYSLLMQALILFDHYFETQNKWDIINIFIITVMIALFASRTPLLCIIIYVYIRAYMSNVVKRSTKNKVMYATIVGIIGFSVFYIFYARDLYQVLLDRGYQSTALRKLLTDPFDDSSRSLIYASYLGFALQRPLSGYGILGGWKLGTYPHNIIIEILLSFGFVAGTAVIGCLIWIIARGLKCKEAELSRLICILCAYNFHLFWSSSLFTSMTFCMLIAACIKSKKCSKKIISCSTYRTNLKDSG